MTNPKKVDYSPQFDHVLFAGKKLSELTDVFEKAGFDTTYGGKHDTAPTHNAVIGFDDGSYIELLSTVDTDTPDPERNHLIQNDAGPCGWAVVVDSFNHIFNTDSSEVDKWGPITMSRETPEGTVAKWELAGYKSAVRGEMLPFFIKDITPRQNRITPTKGISGTELTGVETVVIGTNALEQTTELFESVLSYSSPEREINANEGLELVRYPTDSVILASPTTEDNWLANRLEQFGDGISAAMVGTNDFDSSVERLAVQSKSEWFGQSIGWVTLNEYTGRIGIMEWDKNIK